MTPEEQLAALEQRLGNIEEQMRVLSEYLHHVAEQQARHPPRRTHQ